MAQIAQNSFTSWELSDEEQTQGSIYTITQLQVLQNQLAACAEEKLGIEFDPEHPILFTQKEAYKKGQIDILQYLIVNSDAIQDILIEAAAEVDPDSEE